MLITVSEYAKRNGVSPSTIRHRIARGSTPAVKPGHDWLIDVDTPYIDGRETSGKYKNLRGGKKLKKNKLVAPVLKWVGGKRQLS